MTRPPPRGNEPARNDGTIDWARIEADWAQLKGSAKRQWLKLTDAQLDSIAGKRDALSASVQATYGITRETTERQVSFWQSVQKPKGMGAAENPVVEPGEA
jgi:uncharacterized protein YjbJ (UPF0337 family)